MGLHLDFLEAAGVGQERAAKTGSAEGGIKIDPDKIESRPSKDCMRLHETV